MADWKKYLFIITAVTAAGALYIQNPRTPAPSAFRDAPNGGGAAIETLTNQAGNADASSGLPVPSAASRAEKPVTSPAEVLESSSKFLQVLNKDINSYSNDELSAESAKVLTIAEDDRQPPELRSRAYLIYSGIIGLYGKRNSSSSAGKQSFEALKKAVNLTPKDKSALTVYSTVVVGMANRNFAVKKIIELTLKISLQKEIANAISLLEAISPSEQTSALLKQLKDLKAQ